MSKWKCEECSVGCFFEGIKPPKRCPCLDGYMSYWCGITSCTPPKLTVEEKLPDWCKVGAWVWWKGANDIGYASGYMKITGISNEIINCDAIQGIPIAQNQISEARLRPWDNDSLPKIPFPVKFKRHNPDGFRTTVVSASSAGVWLGGASHATGYKVLMDELDEIDGFPCGVLEHREGEGWVR